jgi:predicted ArsR family transcriptional regulator
LDQLQKHVRVITLSLENKPKKSLYNPSKDLRCLANQVKSHFSDLELFTLVDTEEVGDNEFAIQWLSQGHPGDQEQAIVIGDND